jgi:hypothetical protein
MEVPTKTLTARLFKGWVETLQLLEGCVMVVPDHKPELLEDQEVWMCKWVSMKVSTLSPIGMHMHGRALLFLCIIFQINLEVCAVMHGI